LEKNFAVISQLSLFVLGVSQPSSFYLTWITELVSTGVSPLAFQFRSGAPSYE